MSINQEEAGEKIRYAKSIIEALDTEVRPKLVRDNTYELEFANGSRLISHPCRPVRGKAKAHIYLDEFAHYPNDVEIYQSALPAITKGGIIRIGSSPLGARGVFWEIYSQGLRQYPGYVRNSIPWWHILAMCNDLQAAYEEAPLLPTEDRVYKYGTSRIIEIFENMPLDSFQQEYECAWLDETVSWIDWELIKRNQHLAADGKLWNIRSKTVDDAIMQVDVMLEEVIRGRIEPVFVGGMDVGRRKDTTEIILLGKDGYTNSLPYRFHVSLDRVEFDLQEAVVRKILSALPVTSFLIDQNGIGMQIAERLSFHPAVQGAIFTNETKSLWAVEEKLRFQRGQVPIPMDRDFSYQVHSIRRKTTSANNSIFDTSQNEKHHADMFWAHALAVWAGKDDSQVAVTSPNPLEDYRG